MSKHRHNIIEINGKLYDAKLGVLLSDDTLENQQIDTKRIDGFMAPKPQSIIIPDKPESFTLKHTKPTANRHKASNIKRHTQKSVILMRKSVKKPSKTAKSTEVITKNFSNKSFQTYHKAGQSSRSPFISKYSNASHVIKRTENITVKPHPNSVIPQKNPLNGVVKPTTRSISTKKQISKSEKLFSEALQSTPPPKKLHKQKRGHSKLRWSSGLVALLLLVGFICYLNLPNITVKFAGAKAGFSVSLPAYRPSGYTLKGPVNYDNGRVVVTFKSNTDNRAYTLKQEVSNWNSKTLQENFLVSNKKSFTTNQDNGRTIFIYDNNATWVNGGIWYQVESNALSSDQLINIANSI